MRKTSDAARLEKALAEHRAAFEAFVRAADSIREEDWSRPVASGKWSPGQITEHLSLALEAATRNLEQGAAMRFVLPAWKRFLLRRGMLPRLLSTGRFPRGARAPREIRPQLAAVARQDALDRLRHALAQIESACALVPGAATRRLTHPYFGTLPTPTFVRLLARHTTHHCHQLPPPP